MDTHDRTELLNKLKGVDDIPKRSVALLTWIIAIILLGAGAVAVGVCTGNWNWYN